jgi:hypothetical protein
MWPARPANWRTRYEAPSPASRARTISAARSGARTFAAGGRLAVRLRRMSVLGLRPCTTVVACAMLAASMFLPDHGLAADRVGLDANFGNGGVRVSATGRSTLPAAVAADGSMLLRASDGTFTRESLHGVRLPLAAAARLALKRADARAFGADGRLVSARAGDGANVVVQRFLPAGEPDLGFGVDGVANVDLSAALPPAVEGCAAPKTEIGSVAVDAAGRIYVAGIMRRLGGYAVRMGYNSRAATFAARMTPDGRLDAGFGAGGAAQGAADDECVLFGGQRAVTALRPDGQGGAWIAGGLLQHFSTAGVPTFDPASTQALKVDDQNRLLAALPDGSAAVGTRRVRPDGTIDPGFQLDPAASVAQERRLMPVSRFTVLADGSFLDFSEAPGQSLDALGTTVRKLKPDGSIDPAFGFGGQVVTCSPVHLRSPYFSDYGSGPWLVTPPARQHDGALAMGAAWLEPVLSNQGAAFERGGVVRLASMAFAAPMPPAVRIYSEVFERKGLDVREERSGPIFIGRHSTLLVHTGSCGGPGLANIAAELDGRELSGTHLPAYLGTRQLARYDPRKPKAGRYQLTVRATDRLGVSTTAERTVVLDYTPPKPVRVVVRRRTASVVARDQGGAGLRATPTVRPLPRKGCIVDWVLLADRADNYRFTRLLLTPRSAQLWSRGRSGSGCRQRLGPAALDEFLPNPDR